MPVGTSSISAGTDLDSETNNISTIKEKRSMNTREQHSELLESVFCYLKDNLQRPHLPVHLLLCEILCKVVVIELNKKTCIA